MNFKPTLVILISLIANCLLGNSVAFADQASAGDVARVAIIIDDIGYRATDRQAFELPNHVTFAILPHTEQSTAFAELAYQQGRTVMLHMPMETLQPRNLGPGALFDSMDAANFTATLEEALASVPYASGVNNHMGSKLTQLTLPMTTLMQVLSARQLFFVDSRTTRYSKALKIAQQQGVPSTRRNVFLDHELTQEFIDQQYDLLIRLAQKRGEAVGIGHPHPLTIRRLQQRIAQTTDVEFVAISSLLNGSPCTLEPQFKVAMEAGALNVAKAEAASDKQHTGKRPRRAASTALSPAN